MTDNEQGYTPTDEQAEDTVPRCGHEWGGDSGHLCARTPGHAPMVNGSLRMDHICGCGTATASGAAATLAAHRVTLAADSREALVDGIAFHFNGWFANGYNKTLADRLANEAIDHLLASGVVQVTTPTETDEYEEFRVIYTTWRSRRDHPDSPELTGPIRRSAERAQGAWESDMYGNGEFVRMESRRVAHTETPWSRPAPVAPPTEEGRFIHYQSDGESASVTVDPIKPTEEWEHTPAEAAALDEMLSDLFPVDALGFPTQEGATFTAEFRSGAGRFAFTVLEERGRFRAESGGIIYGTWFAADLDPTSIEDVRPADGRNGQ